jgi:hypothetical protein
MNLFWPLLTFFVNPVHAPPLTKHHREAVRRSVFGLGCSLFLDHPFDTHFSIRSTWTSLCFHHLHGLIILLLLVCHHLHWLRFLKLIYSEWCFVLLWTIISTFTKFASKTDMICIRFTAIQSHVWSAARQCFVLICPIYSALPRIHPFKTFSNSSAGRRHGQDGLSHSLISSTSTTKRISFACATIWTLSQLVIVHLLIRWRANDLRSKVISTCANFIFDFTKHVWQVDLNW